MRASSSRFWAAIGVLGTLPVLAACASSASRPAPTAMSDPAAGIPVLTRIETASGMTEVRTTRNDAASLETSVAATAERAFLLLPEVYESVVVPVNTVLSDTRVAGVRDAPAPRNLNKLPLSRYIDCGAGATGVNKADTYAVRLTALSRVTAAGDSGSVVVTQVSAVAKPMTSGGDVACASTGRLERVINNALALRAAR
jgi:hypothetical protein